MDEELRFKVSVESDGAESASQKTSSAFQQIGQAYTATQTKLQSGAKVVSQTMDNITTAIQTAAVTIQNQYNGMSLSKLQSEFTKIEERIIKQQTVVAQANQQLEEYAALWDQIAASGSRTAGTADQDAELAQLARTANEATAELQQLKAAQQQVQTAISNNTQYNQQMDLAKQKTAQTKMGIDAMAFSLATVGRSAGGTIGQVVQLAEEVRFLKQAFTSTAQTAGTMAATISTAMGAVGIAIMAITIIVGAVTKAEEDARKKAQELREEIRSLSQDRVGAAALVSEYETLSKKIVKTADDTERMKDIRAELVESYGFSVSAIDEEGRLLAGNLEILKEQLAITEQMVLAKLKENENAEEDAYNKALKERTENMDTLTKKAEYLKQLEADLANGVSVVYGSTSMAWKTPDPRDIEDVIAKTQDEISILEGKLGKNFDMLSEEAQTSIDNMFQQMVLEAKRHDGEVPEAIQTAVKAALTNAYLNDQDANQAKEAGQKVFDSYFEIDKDTANSAIEEIKILRQNLILAFSDAGADMTDAKNVVNDILNSILGDDTANEKVLARVSELKQLIYDGLATTSDTTEYDELIGTLSGAFLSAQNEAWDAIQQGIPGAEKATDIIAGLAKQYLVYSSSISKTSAEERALERQEARTKRAMADINDILNDYETGGSAAVDATKDLADEMRNIAAQKKAIDVLKDTASSADDMKKAMDTLKDAGLDGSQITDDLGSVKQAVNEDEAAFITLISTIAASAGVTFNPDTSQFESIQGDADKTAVKLANVLNWLKTLDGTGLKMDNTGNIQAINLSDGLKKVSSGGGGSSKNKALQREIDLLEHYKALDQLTTAEEIANLERIRAKYAKTAADKQDIDEKLYALRRQLQEDELEYQKSVDQLTLREEIAMLDKMIAAYKEGTEARRSLEQQRYQAQRELEKQDYDLKVHYGQLTLEQQAAALQQMISTYKDGVDARIDLEKELYDVQQEIRQRDIDRLNDLTDAVTSALQERYEAQREAEEKTLNESIDAWKEWGDEQVKALQAQIDVIDELTKSEDDAEVEAAKRRKVSMLEQQLIYEQDVYNRRKLQEQLAAAQDDLSKWLRDKEREALKASLQDQIDATNKTVDDQTALLQDQIDANKDYYDELTKAANLNAEAQLLIMQGSQTEIINLLKEFAPEYNATGQSLGEQLVDGFMSSVGNLEDWFKKLTDNLMSGINQRMQLTASVANAAADQFYANRGIPTAAAAATVMAGPTTNVGPTLHVYFTEQREYTPSEIRRELERLLEQISCMDY